ncbi:hypothetical protein VKT23_011503 [Stygiomarasmius scandens]|uniref:Uncharacterized protein n=1 Tax=Marasmiellus scandens TaxID=2682957 RepID=A0ABR1J977_9AGAR
MHRVLNKLKLQKQKSSTRLHPDTDLYATGTSLRSGILKLREARKQRQKTAGVLESDPPATEPNILPTVNSSPTGSDHVATEMATTSSPASNSNSNDPTDPDPFRTILNHSQNPNFNHSVLSNVNGNSTTVTNHYTYNVSGNLSVLRSLDESCHLLREDEQEIFQSAPDTHSMNRTQSLTGIGIYMPTSGGDSRNHSRNNRPATKPECVQENMYVSSGSDRSRYVVVIEARLTSPHEIFELKTGSFFFFFYI